MKQIDYTKSKAAIAEYFPGLPIRGWYKEIEHSLDSNNIRVITLDQIKDNCYKNSYGFDNNNLNGFNSGGIGSNSINSQNSFGSFNYTYNNSNNINSFNNQSPSQQNSVGVYYTYNNSNNINSFNNQSPLQQKQLQQQQQSYYPQQQQLQQLQQQQQQQQQQQSKINDTFRVQYQPFQQQQAKNNYKNHFSTNNSGNNKKSSSNNHNNDNNSGSLNNLVTKDKFLSLEREDENENSSIYQKQQSVKDDTGNNDNKFQPEVPMEEAISFLQTMFPDIEVDTLQLLLEESKGDVTSIVDRLAGCEIPLEDEEEKEKDNFTYPFTQKRSPQSTSSSTVSPSAISTSLSYSPQSISPPSSSLNSSKEVKPVSLAQQSNNNNINNNSNNSNSVFVSRGINSESLFPSNSFNSDAVNDEEFEKLLKELEKGDEVYILNQNQNQQPVTLIKEEKQEEEESNEVISMVEKKKPSKSKSNSKQKKNQNQLVSDYNATVQHVQELFPKYTKREITTYLDRHSYDVNSTIDTLLSLQTIETLEVKSPTSPNKSKEPSINNSSIKDKGSLSTTTTTTSVATSKPISPIINSNNNPTFIPPSPTQNIVFSNPSPLSVRTDSLQQQQQQQKQQTTQLLSKINNRFQDIQYVGNSGSSLSSKEKEKINQKEKEDRELSESIKPLPLDFDEKVSKLSTQFPLVDPIILESIFAESGFRVSDTITIIYDLFPESRSHSKNSVTTFANKVRESGFDNGSFIARGVGISSKTISSKLNQGKPLDMNNKINILQSKPNKVAIYSGNNEETGFRKVELPQKTSVKKSYNSQHEYALNQKSYQEHRLEAEKFARLRNACFQAAAKAYMKGKAAEARQLSEEGKRYDSYHKEANRLASNQIFMECNTRNGDTLKIDLHGLHVGEALEVVQEAIEIHASGEYNSNDDKPKTLNFITGQGNHSQGGVARIKPALIAFLKECGIRYIDRSGSIEVSTKNL